MTTIDMTIPLVVRGVESYHPAAVLIRGLEEISGPGRLTKKLAINKNLNGKMLGRKTGLWIENTNYTNLIEFTNRKTKIIRTLRIGVNYAGPIWSKKLYRFVLQSRPTGR